jgi:ketosteroid isomerase-like protein
MNRPLLRGVLGAAVLLAAGAQAAPAPDPEEIAAAERAFAADGAARGLGPSFVSWAAPDGIVFRPDPVNAREHYAKGPSATGLKWWPVHAGIARSGDLGFDTGPWTWGKASGWFFTIWKKQPDGSWRWLLDHGFDSPPSPLGPDSPLIRAKPAAMGAGDASSAFTQVRAEEAKLSQQASGADAAAALGARLTSDAWLAGLEPGGPARTPEVVRSALARRPAKVAYELLGGEASRAGDLAYVYGRAKWNAGGKAAEGRWVRVWRRDRAGWKIVFDLTTAN